MRHETDERAQRAENEVAARERVSLLAGLVASLGAILALTLLACGVDWTQRHVSLALAAQPELPPFSTDTVVHGREMFATTCTACHGEDGRGRPGLGKDLATSTFIKATQDALLREMIKTGRPANHPLNTTKVAMPPKGGNDALTDSDINDVVAYLRALQSPARVAADVSLIAAPPPPSQADTAKAAESALAAAGGDAELAEYIASGTKLFSTTCIACHGPGGAGVKGNGKALANNPFVQSLDDDALLAFIQKGRDPSDPKNTTGVGMPPKGGNPALSEDDLLDIIAYLRTLQPASPGATAAK